MVEPLARDAPPAAQAGELPVRGVPRVAERQQDRDEDAEPELESGTRHSSAMPVNVKSALTAVTPFGVHPHTYAVAARTRPILRFT